MIKSGSRTGGTGPVVKKRGGKVKKLAMAGPSSNKDMRLDPSAWDTRSSIQRFVDTARAIPVGKNATISFGGGLSNPKLTYKKNFKQGGTVKKAASTDKKSGGRGCW